MSVETPCNALRADLVRMIQMAHGLVVDAVTALQTGDAPLAETVIARDVAVNTLDSVLEANALCVIGCTHPNAGELRFIATTLKVTTDVERVGDQAVAIARTVIRLTECAVSTPLPPELIRMAALTSPLLTDLAATYSSDDPQAAQSVTAGEEELDIAYAATQKELRCRMRRQPSESVAISHLLFIAHHLERIGDHCANAAARLDYVRTGRVFHS